MKVYQVWYIGRDKSGEARTLWTSTRVYQHRAEADKEAESQKAAHGEPFVVTLDLEDRPLDTSR